MKALKITLIGIATLIAIVLVLGLIAPKDYHVTRTVDINAPADLIMEQMVSLKNQNAWSPWTEKDPEQIITYSEKDAAIGAYATWEGNEEVGKGRQEITAITDNRVEASLVFVEPFEDECSTYLQLDEGEEGAQTITWGMEGESPFPFNIMSLFMSMEEMIGPDFEKGLANLKNRCEEMSLEKAEQNKLYRGYKVIEAEMEQKTYYGKRDVVPFGQISEFYMEHLPAVYQGVVSAGLQISGSPCGIFYSWDEENQIAEMAAAIAVSGETTEELDGFERLGTFDGKALLLTYFGAYDQSAEAHYAMDDYMRENGEEQTLVIEEYVTDPSNEPDTAKWQTNIYYLLE